MQRHMVDCNQRGNLPTPLPVHPNLSSNLDKIDRLFLLANLCNMPGSLSAVQRGAHHFFALDFDEIDRLFNSTSDFQTLILNDTHDLKPIEKK